MLLIWFLVDSGLTVAAVVVVVAIAYDGVLFLWLLGMFCNLRYLGPVCSLRRHAGNQFY